VSLLDGCSALGLLLGWHVDIGVASRRIHFWRVCRGWNSVNPDGLDDSGRVVWKTTIVIKAEGQARCGREVGYNHRTMVSYGFISYMVPYHTILVDFPWCRWCYGWKWKCTQK
jgi:hypothetical protein